MFRAPLGRCSKTGRESRRVNDKFIGRVAKFATETASVFLNIGLRYSFCFNFFFSDISERNNDYSDTLDFRRGRVGEVGVVTFFVLEVSDYKSATLICGAS